MTTRFKMKKDKCYNEHKNEKDICLVYIPQIQK